MKDELVNDLMEHHSLSLLVIGNLKEGKSKFIYRRNIVFETNLLANLFGEGDKNSLMKLDEFLKGKIMPQLCTQGDISGVLCKPNEDTIIGAFTTVVRTPPEYWDWSNELDKDVLSLWKTAM